jgi:hypothetical protein
VAGKPGGHPPDPLDVRVAVLLGEAEPLREVRADDVAVEVLDGRAGGFELTAHDGRDGRFPGA